MPVVLTSNIGEPKHAVLGVRTPTALKHANLKKTGKRDRLTATQNEHDDFLENTGACVEDKMAGFSPD